jgi:hypothetical protein
MNIFVRLNEFDIYYVRLYQDIELRYRKVFHDSFFKSM